MQHFWAIFVLYLNVNIWWPRILEFPPCVGHPHWSGVVPDDSQFRVIAGIFPTTTGLHLDVDYRVCFLSLLFWNRIYGFSPIS